MAKNIYAVSYQMKRELYGKIFLVVATILICFAVITFILNLLVYPIRSISDSMAPDIPASSLEFITPLLKSPRRGDVMLVRTGKPEKTILPLKVANSVSLFLTGQQWLPFKNENYKGQLPFLRRVVGLPGDTVYLNDSVLYIKAAGQKQFLTEFELTEKKYDVTIESVDSSLDRELGAKGDTEEITLAAGEYFVLADNRMEALDSRLWGPVTKSQLCGKALVLYFPFNKIRLF